MRANLDATGGAIYAERAVLLLTPAVGRERTQQLVAEALAASRGSGVTFGLALRSATAGERALQPGLLDDIDRPERYLGSAEAIRAQRLGQQDE